MSTKTLSAIVADHMRALRYWRRMTQAQLSARMQEKLGPDTWSRATVSAIERGERVIALDELAPLAEVLQVPLRQLLDEAELAKQLGSPSGVSLDELIAEEEHSG